MVKKHRERKKRIERVKADAEKLKEMMLPHDIAPLCEHSLDPDNWWFPWFKVNNDEEAELLEKYVYYSHVPTYKYPAYVCVESKYDFYLDVENGSIGGEYVVTLDNCIEEAKRFFDKFGLEMTLTKKGEQ